QLCKLLRVAKQFKDKSPEIAHLIVQSYSVLKSDEHDLGRIREMETLIKEDRADELDIFIYENEEFLTQQQIKEAKIALEQMREGKKYCIVELYQQLKEAISSNDKDKLV